MNQPLRLGSIPNDKYSGYRYDVIFKAYKWDPQVEDHNTISNHVVLMNKPTAEQLGTWAEQLSRETALMEEDLIKKIFLAGAYGRRRGLTCVRRVLRDLLSREAN